MEVRGEDGEVEVSNSLHEKQSTKLLNIKDMRGWLSCLQKFYFHCVKVI